MITTPCCSTTRQHDASRFEELEGRSASTRGARGFADPPAEAVRRVKRLEELGEAPAALLSTGPDRDETILVRKP